MSETDRFDHKNFLKTLSTRPGVYRMMDEDGDVLYVGKARSLKKRVAAYTKLTGHTNRIAAMIANTASMEFVTTRTEPEALCRQLEIFEHVYGIEHSK